MNILTLRYAEVRYLDFKGHKLIKIDDVWVFDLTTFIGYKVKLKDNKVKDYTKAFIAIRDEVTGTYSFDKIIRVPIKTLRKTVDIIQKYRKEAFLEDGSC